MNELLQTTGLTMPQFVAIVLCAVAFVLIVLVVRRLNRRKPATAKQIDLTLDVSQLDQAGPPASSPVLELCHVPVRLAALVLAPTGRGNALPPPEHTAAVAEQILPGLGEIFELHRPKVLRWPAQLSTQGFGNTFFSLVRLPGERGRGTPWCAISGRCEAEGKKLLVGLVLRAASDNSLSQLTVERETQWLDMLRVKA